MAGQSAPNYWSQRDPLQLTVMFQFFVCCCFRSIDKYYASMYRISKNMFNSYQNIKILYPRCGFTQLALGAKQQVDIQVKSCCFFSFPNQKKNPNKQTCFERDEHGTGWQELAGSSWADGDSSPPGSWWFVTLAAAQLSKKGKAPHAPSLPLRTLRTHTSVTRQVPEPLCSRLRTTNPAAASSPRHVRPLGLSPRSVPLGLSVPPGQGETAARPLRLPTGGVRARVWSGLQPAQETRQ